MSGIDTTASLSAVEGNKLKQIGAQKPTTDAKLKEQTDAFEALLVKQMLDEAVKIDSPLFPKSAGSDIYKGMYTDAVSHSVAGGFGFSKMLFDYLKNNPKGQP